MIARAPGAQCEGREERERSTRCQLQAAGGCVHKYHDHGIAAERVLPRH
jgi:hypothetical protein